MKDVKFNPTAESADNVTTKSAWRLAEEDVGKIAWTPWGPKKITNPEGAYEARQQGSQISSEITDNRTCKKSYTISTRSE